MKVLGLDLGTNSIGWALIENTQKGKFSSIIASGSRIVPMDARRVNDFERGNTVTNTADRRIKRGMRRQNFRWKMRRDNLLKYLQVLGILPDDMASISENPQEIDRLLSDKPLTDLEIFEIRERAVKEKVSLKELGRVLYHLNQRRGYKPTRSEKRVIKKTAKSNIDYTYGIIETVEPTGVILKNKNEFLVTLSDGTSGNSTDSQFPELIHSQVPLKIVRRKNKAGEESASFTIIQNDDSSWEARLGVMESELGLSKKTPGSYFYEQMTKAKANGDDYRVKDRLVYRKRYLDEFEKIWETQVQFHAELSDDELLAKAVERILPQNSPFKNKWIKAGQKQFLRDYIIYYQRPLKSQKGTVSFCEFEPTKRVIPKSHPLFQEFKVWQQINNIRIQPEDGEAYSLSVDEREFLYQQLSSKPSLKLTVLAKKLGVKPKEIRATEELSGNTTRAKILKALKEAGIKLDNALEGKFELLWHILYSLENEDEETIAQAISKNCGIPEEKTDPFLEIMFDRQFGSLSARAIKRMLPIMKCGSHFDSDNILQVVSEKIEKILDGEADESISPDVRGVFDEYDSIDQFAGLEYWAAATLVYGGHSNQVKGSPYSTYEEIEQLPLYALRNPIVEQMVNETLMLVKAIWEKFGKPDEIHVELAREIKQSAKQRKQTTDRISKRTKEREKVKEILRGGDFGIERPSRKQVERYLLWEEQKCRDLYTGRTIPRSSLFTGETDIDHILPKTRYFDDSFNNKVVTFKKINQEKDNKTATEYLTGANWDEFAARVKANENLSYRKKQYLLTDEIPEDFINRQLRDTSYISKKIKALMERVCPPITNSEGRATPMVISTNGTITDYLKKEWKLDEVFKQILVPRYERIEEILGKEVIKEVIFNGEAQLQLPGYSKRLDHRHHTLDAIVIAVTRRKDIQRLNTLNRIFETPNPKGRGIRKIDLPHPDFKEMVKVCLESIIVSQKSRNRLTDSKANFYSARNREGKLIRTQSDKTASVIRGKLHNETIYGKVREYLKIPVKKAFRRIEDLAVDWQKQALLQRIEENKGDVEKAIKSISKSPLSGLYGKKLENVTVFEEKFTTRQKLSSLTSPMVEKVADVQLKKDIKSHIEKYRGNLKEAFNETGVLAFNQGRKKKVNAAKIRQNASFFPLKEDPENPKYVAKSENYCIIVKTDAEGKRSITPVPFHEAVELELAGEGVKPLLEGEGDFILRAYDPVYVLLEGESPSTVNLAELDPKRVYYFRKSSNQAVYFLPHTISGIIAPVSLPGKINEYGSESRTKFMGVGVDRIKIIQNCIPVYIDRLGNIEKS